MVLNVSGASSIAGQPLLNNVLGITLAVLHWQCYIAFRSGKILKSPFKNNRKRTVASFVIDQSSRPFVPLQFEERVRSARNGGWKSEWSLIFKFSKELAKRVRKESFQREFGRLSAILRLNRLSLCLWHSRQVRSRALQVKHLLFCECYLLISVYCILFTQYYSLDSLSRKASDE